MSESTKQFERSPVNLQYFLVSSGVVTIVLLTISLILLSELRQLLGVSLPTLRLLVFLFFPVTWLISALAFYKQWNKVKYAYGDDGIIIEKQTSFGGSQLDTIPYRSISGVQVNQTRLGQKHDYGDIILKLQQGKETVVLKLISSPQKYVADLQRNIGTSTVHVR